MNKKTGLRKIIVASSFLFFVLYTFTFQRANSNGSQPPSGETNDPVNTMSCAQNGCHSSFQPFNTSHSTISIGTSLSNQVPLNGFQYLFGTQYFITFTALGGSSKPGFEMSALTPSNSNAGTFAITDAVHTSLGTASGIKYIGHKDATNISTWNFKWTAPATNVGNVTFYYAVNRTNNDNTSLGDSIFLQQTVISPVPFSVNAGNNVTICPHSSAQLQATVINNSGTVTYNWSPTSGLSCNTCSNPVASPSSSTTYTVTATNAGQTATNSVSVNLYPSFTPGINTTSDYICPGASDTLSSSGYQAYSWSTGSSSSSALVTQAGTYTLTATNSDNCTASNSIIIQQGQSPSPVISPAQPYLCGNGTDTLSTGAFSSYIWSNNTTTPYINATHGGSYSVTVTNQQGCSASASYNLTSYPLPSANITASGPLTFCEGGSVTLATDTGASFSYKWSTGPTTSSINITQSGIYTVTVYNPCDSAVSSPKIVTVNPNVTPGISISPDVNNICYGTPVVFTATLTNGGALPVYQWEKNGNNVSTDSTYTDSALVNSDNIICTMISNAVCASPPGATSNTIIMDVTPISTPSINISASQTTTCTGGLVVFTASATNEGELPFYQWTKNGFDVGTDSIFYSDSTLNNDDVIVCTLTSNAQCISTATAVSNDITITLGDSASPNVIVAAPPVICSGTTTTFTATPTNGGINPTYQWIKNGNNVGINASTYSDTSIITGDTVYCTMISNASCVSPLNATSNTIITAVTPSVTPTIAISASDTSICAGTSVTFTALSLNGGASPIYQWKKNGNNTGGDSAVYVDAFLSDNDVVNCIFTSNAVCAAPASISSDSVIISVTPVVTPTVTISVSPAATVCSGTLLTFSALSSQGGPSPGYQWQVNGNNVTGAGDGYSSAELPDSAQVDVILTSNALCVSNATAISNTILLRVNPIPATPSITAIGTDSIACNTFADSYQWLLNNETTTFNTKAIHPLQNGEYSIIITLNGCVSDTSPAYNFIISGIEQLADGYIKIYPNPVNDILLFDLPANNNGNLKITLMNLNGKVIMQEKTIRLFAGRNNFEEDLSALPAGVYIMHLRSPDFNQTIKLIKQTD